MLSGADVFKFFEAEKLGFLRAGKRSMPGLHFDCSLGGNRSMKVMLDCVYFLALVAIIIMGFKGWKL